VPVSAVKPVTHTGFVNVPHLKLPFGDNEEDEEHLISEAVAEILDGTKNPQWEDPPTQAAPDVEDEYGLALATPGPLTTNL